jgi:hypothetical protein
MLNVFPREKFQICELDAVDDSEPFYDSGD